MNAQIISLDSALGSYRQLVTRYDADYGILWYYMNPEPRPCFNMDLLADIRKCQRFIQQINQSALEHRKECPIRYGVLASRSSGVYSLGGDLDLFIKLIRERDQEGLTRYARACIDSVHLFAVNLNLPMTTISLVQGDALGGGFEGALCCSVIVAEKSAKFGLPEILFNLFPGMGAYSFLARRLDAARAERMILSGNVYSASELHEMGIVDVLAEDSEGEKAVYEYIKRHSRRQTSFQALFKVRERYRPISREELIDIGDIWVDTALKLGPKDIRLMERLVKSQDKLPTGLVALNRTADGHA
jgi:DSF synthase